MNTIERIKMVKAMEFICRNLNELSDCDCITEYNARREEIVPLIPEIAQIVRKQKDNWGADFPAAVGYAIPEVLKNHGK